MRTDAAQRLLDLAQDITSPAFPMVEISPEFLAARLTVIETEAVSTYRARLRERVADETPSGLQHYDDEGEPDPHGRFVLARDFLALIDEGGSDD